MLQVQPIPRVAHQEVDPEQLRTRSRPQTIRAGGLGRFLRHRGASQRDGRTPARPVRGGIPQTARVGNSGRRQAVKRGRV